LLNSNFGIYTHLKAALRIFITEEITILEVQWAFQDFGRTKHGYCIAELSLSM